MNTHRHTQTHHYQTLFHLSLSPSLLLHWIFQESVDGMAAQHTMTARGINKVLIERNDVILILRPLNLRHVGAAVTFTGMNGAFGGVEDGGWWWCIYLGKIFLHCTGKQRKMKEGRRRRSRRIQGRGDEALNATGWALNWLFSLKSI